MKIPNLDKDPTGRTLLIQEALAARGLYAGPLDNWAGKGTDAALAAFLASSGDAPASVADSGTFSSKALALIAEFEGFDQPGRWPGAASGVTIGVGYDLGYTALQTFRRDWAPYLSGAVLDRLDDAIGAKGDEAQDMAPRFRDITIRQEDALKVFHSVTIPTYSARTFKAFPGIERLPLDAQGALVSLVFNRGEKMDGDSRREMAEIRRIISVSGDVKAMLPKIAAQIRAMKRLWDIEKLRGLHRRRDAEAALVESAL